MSSLAIKFNCQASVPFKLYHHIVSNILPCYSLQASVQVLLVQAVVSKVICSLRNLIARTLI